MKKKGILESIGKSGELSVSGLELTDVILSSPASLLQRLVKEVSTKNQILVNIGEKNGVFHNGFIGNMNLKEKILLLYNIDSKKSLSLNYIDLNNVSSLEVMRAQEFSHVLTGIDAKEKMQFDEEGKKIDFDDYIYMINSAFEQNHNCKMQFQLKDINTKDEHIESRIKVILDYLREEMFEILGDDYGRELLSEVDTVQLQNEKEKDFNVLKRSNKLIVRFDLEEKLPDRFESLLKRKLEQAL